MIIEIFISIAVIVIVAAIIIGLCGNPVSKPIKRHCEKNPDKICPYEVTYDFNGGMHASGHLGCCKVIDQYKALNDMIASAKPGKPVGEFVFGADIIKQAKDQKEELDKIDSSGPRW